MIEIVFQMFVDHVLLLHLDLLSTPIENYFVPARLGIQIEKMFQLFTQSWKNLAIF
jgi:hypothetical protein